MSQPMISKITEKSEQASIANINRRERRKRLASGLIMFGVSFAVLVILIATGASRWWRLALFPLLWGAAVGFFQWRDKTWVGLAARGSRQLRENVEKIEDAAEVAQVQQQARRLQIKAFLVAMFLNLIALFLP